jgi:hypothetical protein
MNPCVHVVYQEYTDRFQQEGLGILAPWVARVLPGLPVDFVVVDNAVQRAVESSLTDNVTLVNGDNSSREFSGLDRGVAWFAANRILGDDDVFVLANDTFHRSYGTDYLDRFSPNKVRRSLAQGRIVGHVDAYHENVELFGLTLRTWVRTNLLVLTYAVLRRLSPLAIPFEDEQVFSSSYPEFFREDAPLSTNYKALLHGWLLGESPEGVPVKKAWRSHQKLTEENVALLRAKARAILCEHYLSARAHDYGIRIDDVRGDIRRYGRTRRIVDDIWHGTRELFS